MPSAPSWRGSQPFPVPAQSVTSGTWTGGLIFTLAEGEPFFERTVWYHSCTLPPAKSKPNGEGCCVARNPRCLEELVLQALLLWADMLKAIYVASLHPRPRVGGEGWLHWDCICWIGAAHASQESQDWATAWGKTSRLRGKPLEVSGQ